MTIELPPDFERLKGLDYSRLSLREVDLFEKISGIPIDKISPDSNKALIVAAQIVVGFRRRGIEVTADDVLDHPDFSELIDTDTSETDGPTENPTDAGA